MGRWMWNRPDPRGSVGLVFFSKISPSVKCGVQLPNSDCPTARRTCNKTCIIAVQRWPALTSAESVKSPSLQRPRALVSYLLSNCSHFGHSGRPDRPENLAQFLSHVAGPFGEPVLC